MELVSANTRNFLFLTISQYNDQQKDVRARVSMRRDQPFWEGGNSFIACESFRISAAPSPGGLFYKQITPDYFLGARYDTAKGDSSWDPQNNVDRLIHEEVLAVGRSPDALWLIDSVHNPEMGTLAGKLQIALQHDLFENRTQDLLERFSRYLNPMRLTRGSYLKLVGDDDADNPIWVTGTVQRAPSHLITGNGAGPSNLWTPRLQFMGTGPFFDDCQASAAGVSMPVDIVVINDGNLRQDKFEILMRKVLSSGLACIECNRSAKVPNFVGPVVDGAAFKIRGPRNINTQNDKLMSDGVLTEIVSWKPPLRAGSKLVGVDSKHAKVTDFDPSWIAGRKVASLSALTAKIFVELTAAGKAAITNGTLSENVLRGNYSLTASDKQTQLVTGPIIEVKIDDWDHKDADGQDKKDVPTPFDGPIEHIYLRNTDTKQQNLMRHADPDTTRTVYTPNEFFRIFNSDDAGAKVPWSLSTDANGGFVVNWEPKDQLAYTSLIVSKTMTTELGLLNYMSYDATIGGGISAKAQYATISQPDTYGNDNFTNAFSTVPASQLYANEELVDHFDWATANAQPTTGYGLDAWLVDGTKVKIMSTNEETGTNEDSHEIRIYGDLVEEDGEEFYQYHSLPPKARLGNTGEVSVESFSTYSQIDLVIPNLPFQPMLGSNTDNRILASLRLPFEYGTNNDATGRVTSTNFSYYGDLLYNSDSSRSYLRITTDQQLYDCDVEARLIKRNGEMTRMKLPYKGQFQVKLRFLQTQ